MRRVALAGGSGRIGAALQRYWTGGGTEVVRLVRRPAGAPGEVEWDPAAGRVDGARLADCDVLVNLAGENIAGGRWTAERKRQLRESRLQATSALAAAVAGGPWRPQVWINASAVGYYGDAGETVLDENAPQGSGFLATLCGDWERATRPAEAAGVRVVRLRLGVVLEAGGGALAKLLPVFRAGVGGPVGDGRQWLSWIGRDELCRVVDTVARDDRFSGAVNAVAPEPVRNAEFAAVLSRVLRRPAVVRAPAWAVGAALGELGRETVLASQRAVPRALLAHGFDFAPGGLESALRAALTE